MKVRGVEYTARGCTTAWWLVLDESVFAADLWVESLADVVPVSPRSVGRRGGRQCRAIWRSGERCVEGAHRRHFSRSESLSFRVSNSLGGQVGSLAGRQCAANGEARVKRGSLNPIRNDRCRSAGYGRGSSLCVEVKLLGHGMGDCRECNQCQSRLDETHCGVLWTT